MKARKGEKHVLKVFDTWTDFVNFAEANANQLGPSHLNGDDFAGASFEEAIEYARIGWKHGVDQITMISTPIFKKISSRIPKRRIMNDIVGGTVVVGRYLTGMPDHMMRYKQTKQTRYGKGKKNLHIVFNQSASGIIPPGVLQARGAAVAALSQLLEFAGFTVDVTLVSAHRGFNFDKNLTWQMRVPLKRSGAVFDVSRLAYGLSHPSCLRRLTFGAIEGSDDYQSLGAPMEISQWVNDGDLYIGAAIANAKGEDWKSEEWAMNWIIDRIEEQGIELK